MPSTADLEPVSGLPYLPSSSWTRLSSELMWLLSCSMTCSEDMLLAVCVDLTEATEMGVDERRRTSVEDGGGSQ